VPRQAYAPQRSHGQRTAFNIVRPGGAGLDFFGWSDPRDGDKREVSLLLNSPSTPERRGEADNIGPRWRREVAGLAARAAATEAGADGGKLKTE